MFRIKIAFLSVLISGTVLILFGLFLLRTVNQVGLDRIDREILTLGESQLHVWHTREHWQNFDESLSAIYGRDRIQELIVEVLDAHGRVFFKSTNWPEEITVSLFPGFDSRMAPELIKAGELKPGSELRPPLPGPEGPPVPLHPPLQGPITPVFMKKPVFRTIKTSFGAWRAAIMGNEHITIMIGRGTAGLAEDAGQYSRVFFLTVPLALLLLAGGGYLVAHRALRPVAVITRTAEAISARELGRRIPEAGADSELLILIRVINDMLNRLEKSFLQAARFSADAAHELQTPLAILQGSLDEAIRQAEPDTEEQQRYAGLLEEVQRLKNIIKKLLILAQADADRLPLRPADLDLAMMVRAAAEDAEIMGPGLNIELVLPERVVVRADSDLIRLVLNDLTGNAVKYNVSGGTLKFDLTDGKDEVRLVITNSGVAIPEDERELIFERFYRVDKSRGSRAPGTGLGLSLAREIIRAHQGTLRLEPPDKELISFSITLPR